MKKILSMIAFCLVLAGCGPSSTQAITSGVEGHVFIGPACPVVQVDNPCTDKPYQATLTVLDAQGKKILQFQTDVNGAYHVPLKPGEYVMHPESPGVMPNASEQPFTIQAGEFTKLDITYDSGIR